MSILTTYAFEKKYQLPSDIWNLSWIPKIIESRRVP